MKSDWKITYFKPEQQGISLKKNSVEFAAYLHTDKECGVILYDKKGTQHRIPFQKEERQGSLYGIQVEGADLADYTYNYYIGKKILTDPYAHEIYGLEKWGERTEKKRKTYGRLGCHEFDWQKDAPLMIPLEDSILYGINVRAFTMHKSSGVKNRGTFEGIVEKIPYLKELGITGIVLMPCYEYDECMILEENIPDSFSNKVAVDTMSSLERADVVRLNCWGFQNGYYFAPKSSYSADKSPVISFKKLVQELHKNGIEVMMHFYFPPEIRQLYMLDVIKYWVREYHIDGVRIDGFHIPFRLLAEEPALKNTKIWCRHLPEEDLPVIQNVVFKNFISDNSNFRYDMRRFLKGDEGLLDQAIYYHRCNPKEYGVINYLADYDGFSLYDCVTYERKHNEKNGEDNRDGNDINATWNCGFEGDSRRKPIQELRIKQIKNALSFVFLAQGVPFIFGGDEFASSRAGNNNCYCQDNEIGWVNWKNNFFSREILAYVKFLIKLRRNHPILHMKEELKVMDYKGCGDTDISYHGSEAWRPDLGYLSRKIGIALCGQYAPGRGDASFYIACNMHWEEHKLALPKFSKDEKWVRISDTAFLSEKDNAMEDGMIQEDTLITVGGRSIVIFMTEKCDAVLPEKNRKTIRKKKEK